MLEDEWWRRAVIYQVYPRSYADSNGDGIGDLRGITARLDYLEWLGVDAIWLSPITPSPNADWGYDVADYCAVDPDFGTMADLDELISEASARRIRVLLDLVPNHTSDRHPWFVDARSARDSRHRDWYVWADAKPEGGPPNNWTSTFGGPAWTWDEKTQQYYLHNFLSAQPDLNWWNPEVRDAFDEILRFWFGRGVAGFRIDVAHMIIKDRELRDNPPATEDDDVIVQRIGQRQIYNVDRPEVHEVLRRWRTLADSYDPPRLLLGETFLLDFARVAAYYGHNDALHLCFNFPFALAPLDAGRLRTIVARTESLLPADAWPVWTSSNHDVGRFATRWCASDRDKISCALMLLLTLRGTSVLYYGDEIGMPEVELSYEQLLDPVGTRGWPDDPGRDGARTPMQWSAAEGAGFTRAGVSPWLPLGDQRASNVEAERADPRSVLTLSRDLIALAKQDRDLSLGAYRELTSPEGVWAYERGEGVVVALNLSDRETSLDHLHGVVRIGTRRERDGEQIEGQLTLAPWEGVVLTRADGGER